ncbi:kinase-like domain-containing protein [Melampsora americana]|nr:kinase-like domain-containing protein [Melampsora americana]
MKALSFTNSENHLTPPPTPDTRPQKPGSTKPITKLAESLNGPNFLTLRGLPPTPSTSPTNKVHSPLTPHTISAKALSLHRIHPLFDKTYLLGDELGSGGFGFVVQATRQNDGLLCAVKFIYKDKVPSHAWVKDEFWGDEDDSNGILRSKDGAKRVPLEAYVLKTIKHRGVVSYVDLFEDQSYLYLVMEHHGTPWTAPEKENKPPLSSLPLHQMADLMKITPAKKKPLQPYVNGTLLPAGPRTLSPSPFLPALSIPTQPPAMMRRSSCDLFECIEQHSRLPEHFAKYVFAQLVDVVGCLHYNGFVHRDIKDENIVIDDKYRVKLIDFGSTFLFDYRKEVPSLSRFYGTMNFAAPEILKKGTYQPVAAEIWSLGILLTILVTGESFFRDTEAVKAYRASAPNSPISESCMDLIFRCLAYDPNDRWNCFRIRSHPWLADCLWPWSDLPRDAALEGIKLVRK